MKRLGRICFVLIASVVLAGVHNRAISKHPILWIRASDSKIVSEDGEASITASLADVQRAFQTGAVLIDARKDERFAEGHIPDAISMPVELVYEMELDPQDFVPLDVPVIVYCDGNECTDSKTLRALLLEQGYLDVRIFEGGITLWSQESLEIETGESAL
jgi:rhodanese-related sulfurtransferase